MVFENNNNNCARGGGLVQEKSSFRGTMNTMNRFPRIGVGILIVLFRIRETFHMNRVERRFSDMYLLRTSGDGAHKPLDI